MKRYAIRLLHLVGPNAGRRGVFYVKAATYEAAIQIARRCWPSSLVMT